MATPAENPKTAPDNEAGQGKNNVIDLDERRRLFTQAITVFVGEQNLIKALKREELAQLEGIQRHLALSKSLLPNIIRICRRNRRADTRLAVLTLITLLCDNNEGVCRLSVIRMAELLSRKEDNVRKAINNLEARGELFVNRVNGLPNSYWPRVPVEISTMNPAMTWFVDALSTKPAPRGRPTTQSSIKCSPAIGGPFENRSKNLPREASKSPPLRRTVYL